MSTRCQIGVYSTRPSKETIKDFEALLYRHSDGYPDTKNGVLNDVVPFLKWWKTERGLDDTEYVSARLLQHLCNLYDKASTYDKPSPFTGTLGHGISRSFHWDIEYYYAVYPDGVDVYDVRQVKFKPEGITWERAALAEEVTL